MDPVQPMVLITLRQQATSRLMWTCKPCLLIVQVTFKGIKLPCCAFPSRTRILLAGWLAQSILKALHEGRLLVTISRDGETRTDSSNLLISVE
jgi:hypothetical protein